MNLPVLSNVNLRPDDAALVRMAYKLELDDARSLGEESVLDAGIAISSRVLNRVEDANRMFDASVAPGASVESVVREVGAFFAEQGTRCLKYAMNPSVPVEQTRPLAEYLLSEGYVRKSAEILRLELTRRDDVLELAGAQIIPARASFRHARALAETGMAGRELQLVDARTARLENPQYEEFLLLQNGQALGCAGVLSGGEACLITNVFTHPDFRRIGVARQLMSRVLDHCARSLFKHVLLTVDPANAPAGALYSKFGFQKIGDFIEFVTPENG